MRKRTDQRRVKPHQFTSAHLRQRPGLQLAARRQYRSQRSSAGRVEEGISRHFLAGLALDNGVEGGRAVAHGLPRNGCN